jgi:hypothetical protein
VVWVCVSERRGQRASTNKRGEWKAEEGRRKRSS